MPTVLFWRRQILSGTVLSLFVRQQCAYVSTVLQQKVNAGFPSQKDGVHELLIVAV